MVALGCRALRRIGLGRIAASRAASRAERFCADFRNASACRGLCAEFAVRSPFGDVEIDFERAALGQDEVDPKRQREFERLAHETTAWPEEQILRELLRDGRSAAHLGEVALREGVAQLAKVNSVVTAEAGVLAATTASGSAGAMRPSGTATRSTRAPVIPDMS